MSKFFRGQGPAPKPEHDINQNIKASEVRLIGPDGESLGVVLIEDALRAAASSEMDLVLIAPEAEPPVAKILDYGKYKYELHKKKTESRKKQKITVLKEVQLRPNINENDLLVKCKAIKKFIEAGDKVKLVLRFRGREMQHRQIGLDLVEKVKQYCEEFAKEENPTKMEGSTVITILTAK